MTLLEAFVEAAEGRCLDLDHFYGCQCVDLADAWAHFMGLDLPLVGVAADFVGYSARDWSWTPNTPSNAPRAGDLVVWGYLIGPAGHIDLAIADGDGASFWGLDQNWFGSNPERGSPGARVRHDYYGVAGWLTPHLGVSPMPPTPFYVTVNPGARWYGTAHEGTTNQPIGAEIAAGMGPLKVVEVSSQPDHFYYRTELGSWWLRDVDCVQVAAPGPAEPPTEDLAARVTALETRLGRILEAFRV